MTIIDKTRKRLRLEEESFKIWWKYFLLSKWVPRLIYGSLGLFMGILLGYILFVSDKDIPSVIKAMTPLAILLSVMLASRQFVYNGEWNKKQLAISRLHESRLILKDLQNKLHGHLEVLERNKNQPFELPLIHDSLGVKLNDGTFVFHGEHTPEDIKKIPKIQTEKELFSALNFLENTNGREIKDNILDFLGEYEFICSAVNNDVFDDAIVKKLFQNNIVRIYNIFQPYIEHLQVTHEYGKVVFCELENVAIKYSDNAVEA